MTGQCRTGWVAAGGLAFLCIALLASIPQFKAAHSSKQTAGGREQGTVGTAPGMCSPWGPSNVCGLC